MHDFMKVEAIVIVAVSYCSLQFMTITVCGVKRTFYQSLQLVL